MDELFLLSSNGLLKQKSNGKWTNLWHKKSFTFHYIFTVKEFTGNSDQDTHVPNKFNTSVRAKFIRLLPTQWTGHISLRFEVLGCDGKYYIVKLSSHLTHGRDFAYWIEAFPCPLRNTLASVACTIKCFLSSLYLTRLTDAVSA